MLYAYLSVTFQQDRWWWVFCKPTGRKIDRKWLTMKVLMGRAHLFSSFRGQPPSYLVANNLTGQCAWYESMPAPSCPPPCSKARLSPLIQSRCAAERPCRCFLSTILLSLLHRLMFQLPSLIFLNKDCIPRPGCTHPSSTPTYQFDNTNSPKIRGVVEWKKQCRKHGYLSQKKIDNILEI